MRLKAQQLYENCTFSESYVPKFSTIRNKIVNYFIFIFFQ